MILGLIGWINQDCIAEQWRWYATVRPFLTANFWPYSLAPAAEWPLKPTQSFKECTPEQGKDYCPEMVVIPAGSFIMGSPASEQGHTRTKDLSTRSKLRSHSQYRSTS